MPADKSVDLTLKIPAGIAKRVVDALCEMHGYGANGGPQPRREEFARRVLVSWVKDQVSEYETRQAMDGVAEQAQAKVERDIDLQ